MDDTIDAPDMQPGTPEGNEHQALQLGSLSSEQLAMIASAWEVAKQSDTPMADLRSAMSASGLFDFLDKYQTNNIELRTIATAAHQTLEQRHSTNKTDEPRAIVDAVRGKMTYAEKRAALSDLIGFGPVYDMTNTEIDALIRDAEAELGGVAGNSSDVEAPGVDGDVSGVIDKQRSPRQDNRELAGQVADLLDGQLAVNVSDRVYYGKGATALGKKVGGKFAPSSQLRDIVAHADQIRDGLASRGSPSDVEPEAPDTSEPAVSGSDTPENPVTPGDEGVEPAFRVTDNRSSRPEATTNATNEPAPAEAARHDEPELQSGPLVLSFIDQTRDALAAARDAAEARRRNELQQGGGFKRFIKNVWMGENGFAGAYYLEKYKKEALAEIERLGDVLVHESTDTDARTKAQLATIERFQSQYDESIHEGAGERRVELTSESEFSMAVKDLLRRYVSGEITDQEALREERGRILEQLANSGSSELVGEGKVRIDNIVSIADQVRAMVDHGESLDRVLAGMKVYSGESRSNVRSESHLDKVERLVDRLQRSKLGGFVSPETIGVAAAVSLGVARVGRGTLLRAAGVTLAPGVLGGAFAAMRESKRLKQERALHAREMAQGKRYETGKRRDELEATRYETVDATTLASQLESLLDSADASPSEVQAAYETLAEAEARIRLSDKRNIDLVAYSDVVSVEQERRRLDEARALAKVRLAGQMGVLPDEFRTRFGITDNQSVNDALGRYTDAVVELDEDIDAKDKAYRSLRRRRVAKAAAIGAGTSLVLGLGAQELVAFASPSYDGLAEHLVHGGSPSSDGRQTVLEGLVHGQTAGTHVEHIAPSSTYDSYALGTHQHALELPSNYTVVTNADGTLSVEAPSGGHSIEGLTLQKDGSLSPHSLAVLKEHNISVSDTSHTVTHEVSTIKQVSVAEYNRLHAADTTHVTRDFWYDNNTPNTYDKNELGLDWGDNSGVSQHDTIQMNVSHMTQGGSYHDGDHTSWSQDASDGKLKLAISGSRDTQAQVYFVNVKPDGTIDIPKDSPAAKFFSIDSHGHAEFHGAYAEVVDVHDQANGVTHMSPLATVVGDNSVKQIPETVTTKTYEHVPQFKLTPPAVEHITHTSARTVEGFGMPGIAPRRALERLREAHVIRQPETDPFAYAYGGGRSLEDMRHWVADVPNRLKTRQLVDIDGEQKWVEADGSPVERSVDRERQVIDEYLTREYRQNPSYETRLRDIANELGPMDDNCRVSVNIPAWLEEKSLTHLLLEYFDQRDKDGNLIDPSLFEVNIIVNRKEGTQSDNSVAVINSFISQYATRHGGRRPKVHYVDVELKPENATVGYARKLLTDATLLRSLSRTNQIKPLYIESEDADLLKVDKRVIVNLISKLDKNPHLDAVHGVEGRLPSVMKENDLLMMRRNAWETFLLLARQKKYRDPTSPSWNSFANRTITGGWNTGYSAEAYALIGGYEPVRSGEDISIGERISMIRGDGQYPNLETVGSVPTRTESSPRRFINEIIRNKSAYEGFGEGVDEQYIRDKSPHDLMDEIADYSRITDDNKPVFEAEATMFYDWCKSATPTLEDAKEMTKRVMLSVGYKPGDYRFVGDKVEVANWSNVSTNLAAYRSQFSRAQRPSRKMVLSGWKRPDLRTSVTT